MRDTVKLKQIQFQWARRLSLPELLKKILNPDLNLVILRKFSNENELNVSFIRARLFFIIA